MIIGFVAFGLCPEFIKSELDNAPIGLPSNSFILTFHLVLLYGKEKVSAVKKYMK